MAAEGSGKTLAASVKKTEVAEIVKHGDKLIIPSKMTIPSAIDLLNRRMKFEEEIVKMSEEVDVFPWDGANALNTVLTRIFGWTPAEAIPGFFGSTPPNLISIPVGPKEKRSIPWGRLGLPNTDGGYIDTSANTVRGRLVFRAVATVKRKDEATIQNLFEQLREECANHSIYRGKAIKVRFKDDDGDRLEMPEPEFIETEDVDENMLVYPAKTQNAIETNLFTPIVRLQDCLLNNIPVKRGVLLGGDYGTGKTLAAKVASKLAVRHGVTYLYVTRADELAIAIEFAKQYQQPGCVVFCEDIDRALNQERSVAVDDILNIIDGIDTKSSRIITVLTTNALHSIEPAMLRPGRLDAVIDVLPPDAEAAERLVRLYAGKAVSPDTDLKVVGERLDGVIPAVIAEVVKRAKLSELRRSAPGTVVTKISAQALLEAAETMDMQLALLKPPKKAEVPPLERAFHGVIIDAIENRNKFREERTHSRQ